MKAKMMIVVEYMKVIFWVDELSKQCNIPKNLSSIVTVNESGS